MGIEDAVYRSASPLNRQEVRLETCKPDDSSFPSLVEKGMEKENFEGKMHWKETVPVFGGGGCAPEVPADIYFRFAETTIEVNDTAADCLGNRLVDILSTEYTMHIMKTSLHKFVIKAE